MLQYSVTITEQGCVIAHEIFGMVESSVAVHSTPFQIFTNSQLMLRPDITTNLWPAPIQSRILKRACLSPQCERVLVNTTTHFPPFVRTLNSGSAILMCLVDPHQCSGYYILKLKKCRWRRSVTFCRQKTQAFSPLYLNSLCPLGLQLSLLPHLV